MKAAIIGNRRGIYISPFDNEAFVVPSQIVNYDDVNMEGVNNVVIRRSDSGEMKIVQAGGWTCDRGMFVDLY